MYNVKRCGGFALLLLSDYFKYPMEMKLFHSHRIFINGGGGVNSSEPPLDPQLSLTIPHFIIVPPPNLTLPGLTLVQNLL